MKKLLCSALLSSISLTLYASIPNIDSTINIPDTIYKAQNVLANSQNLVRSIKNQVLYKLKKIFPKLIIFEVSDSKVGEYLKADTNIGVIYFLDTSHILLGSQNLYLLDYKGDMSRNVSQYVSDNIGMKILKSNTEGVYRYFQSATGATVIMNKDLSNPHAIMGAFSTIDSLLKLQKKSESKPSNSQPSVVKPSVNKKEMGYIKALNFINNNYSDNIVKFKSKVGNKGTITVFTDYTCPHCQELHRHMSEFLNKGYNIDYIIMPRDSSNHEVERNMQMALCSYDPKSAVNSLYENHHLPVNLKERPNCHINIKDNLNMATGFNIQGTPMLIGSNGKVSSGFNSVYSSLSKLDLIS